MQCGYCMLNPHWSIQCDYGIIYISSLGVCSGILHAISLWGAAWYGIATVYLEESIASIVVA